MAGIFPLGYIRSCRVGELCRMNVEQCTHTRETRARAHKFWRMIFRQTQHSMILPFALYKINLFITLFKKNLVN